METPVVGSNNINVDLIHGKLDGNPIGAQNYLKNINAIWALTGEKSVQSLPPSITKIPFSPSRTKLAVDQYMFGGFFRTVLLSE